jgi:hypothetical protein
MEDTKEKLIYMVKAVTNQKRITVTQLVMKVIKKEICNRAWRNLELCHMNNFALLSVFGSGQKL